MKKVMLILFTALLLAGCTQAIPAVGTENTQPQTAAPETTQTQPVTETEPPRDALQELLSGMILEEKVGQMFLGRCRRETALQDIVDFCGGIKEGVTLGKVISGGPMMGRAMTDLSSPLIKQNNGLLLFSKEKATIPEPSACIRCGRCINGCPMGLAPVQISEAYTARDYDQLNKLNIGLCVACGTCSFVCPAKRPVTQNMALAKAFYMGELRRQQVEAKAKAEEAAKKAEEGGNK